MKNLIEQLLAFIFIGVLVLVVYKMLPKGPSGILAEKEGFSNAGDKITPEDLKGNYEIVAGPGTADLNPRSPYHLLQGVLADAPVDNQDNNRLNSCACYNIDFANRIQRTGNYTQLTNNYKRANPDSCSAPFHELVNNFYMKQTLNQ
jgi:hypothetical protein